VIQTEAYRIPDGYYDLPWLYTFDARDLTDGQNYRNTSVRIADGGDFILRRICGLPNVAAQANIHDSQGFLYAGDAGVVIPPDKLLVPERIFKNNSQLLIDLFNVNRATNGAGIYFSQLAFQGVLRKPGSIRYPQDSKYAWYPTWFVYDYDFTVDWAGTDRTPRHFGFQVTDVDFELQRITAVTKTFTGAVANWAPWEEFQLLLFDPGSNPLMDKPVNDYYLIDNQTATLGSATGRVPTYNGVFPVPSVMYPQGSWIKFDIVSLMPQAWLPATYQICFEGVRRYQK
jgi:hypothetical protein